MNNSRLGWVDVLRFCGIVLMVVGHSGCPPPVSHMIYGFHMPLFFALSGFLYNNNKWQNKGFVEFTKNRAKAYLVPYMVWGIINLFFNSVHEATNLSFEEWGISQLKHIFWLIYSYGSKSMYPNCTPLWFLPCLFVANLYMFLLHKYFCERKRIIVVSLLSLFAFVQFKYTSIHLPWHIDIACIGSLFMYIGMRIRQTKCLYSYNIMFCIISTLTALLCIKYNTRVDMQSGNFGNPILFIIGAIGCIYISFIIFSRLLDCNGLIVRVGGGKNTIVFIALNYFIKDCFSTVFGYLGLPFPWWLDCIVVISICTLTIIIFENSINNLYEKYT